MKIDYIEDPDPASSDNPLIRIYGTDKDEFTELYNSIELLYSEKINEVKVHEIEGYIPINGIKLFLSVNSKDLPVLRKDGLEFYCNFSKQSWENILELIEPFSLSTSGGFQWLDPLDPPGTDEPDISLLISSHKDGSW